jgi:hypothetical protein
VYLRQRVIFGRLVYLVALPVRKPFISTVVGADIWTVRPWCEEEDISLLTATLQRRDRLPYLK